MTTQLNEEEFINLCAKGNFEAAEKKLKKDNLDINCKEKQTLNTAAHVAALNEHLEVLRMLANNGFNFKGSEELQNNQGIGTKIQAILLSIWHAKKPNQEIMLFLMMQGSDYTIKNKKQYKAGENNLDARMYLLIYNSFLSNTLVPEEKAFNVLGEEQKKKLTQIYSDIDFDELKAIDLHKAVRFNKYIQENIPEAKAEKDANDFLKSTAICNKHSVNIDQWVFAFSKLYVCDPDEFNKFLEDYDAAVALQGKLKDINI